MIHKWLSELGLPQTQDERDIAENWRRVRDESSAHWVDSAEDRPGYWVVGRHRDVSALAREPGLSSARGNMLTSLLAPGGDPAGGRLMAVMDAPHHSKIRRLIQGTQFREFIGRAPGVVARRVSDLLTPVIGAGDICFAEAVSDRLPISIVCELLGVPSQDEGLLLALSKQSLSSDQPYTDPDQNRRARTELVEYFQHLAADPTPGSLVDTMVRAAATRNGELRYDDVALNCYGILLAGDETTRLTLNALAWTMATQPAVWEELVSGRVRPDTAGSEILRLATPATHFARVATRDFSIGDVRVAEGDIVSAWLVSANLDDEVFEDPETVQLARPENRHLAFGFGMHYCLGAALARMQIEAVLREIQGRCIGIDSAGTPTQIYSTFLRGFATMPTRLSHGRSPK